MNHTELTALVTDVSREFNRENITIEINHKLKQGIVYHQLRFPKLLFDLDITTNPREKLMIKVDYSTQWVGQSTEVVLLNKYGFIEQIVTNQLDKILVQKLAAYVTRNTTQPRDIFDIVWIYAQGARPDRKFMEVNRQTDLIDRAKEKFAREGTSEVLIRRLRPFLFDEREISKTKLLGEVLKKL